MLIMDTVGEKLKRSKYFRKHYIVEDAELEEVACLRCGCVFAIDYKWTKVEYDKDEYGPWLAYRCPYCGTKNREWVG